MDSTVFYPSLFSTKYAKAKKVLEGGPMSPKARSALTETSDEAAAKNWPKLDAAKYFKKVSRSDFFASYSNEHSK